MKEKQVILGALIGLPVSLEVPDPASTIREAALGTALQPKDVLEIGVLLLHVSGQAPLEGSLHVADVALERGLCLIEEQVRN